MTDESCFTVRDIAKYLSREFAGRQDVLLDELWNILIAIQYFHLMDLEKKSEQS